MSRRKSQDDYHEIIRSLSDRLVEAQTPIRVLDAIKWDDSIRQGFLKAKGREMPAVDRSYYDSRPLAFDATATDFSLGKVGGLGAVEACCNAAAGERGQYKERCTTQNHRSPFEYGWLCRMSGMQGG